jgi:transposase InsO family protein
VLLISERRACSALGQHRSTQRKIPRGREDEEQLTADIIELARQYGRYGYRKIAELLRRAGWLVNDTGRADLGTRGAEGPRPATEAGSFVAERRIMHASQSRAP